jgi:hypothetical protein
MHAYIKHACQKHFDDNKRGICTVHNHCDDAAISHALNVPCQLDENGPQPSPVSHLGLQRLNPHIDLPSIGSLVLDQGNLYLPEKPDRHVLLDHTILLARDPRMATMVEANQRQQCKCFHIRINNEVTRERKDLDL